MKLNKNDYLLLEYCADHPRSISEIAKELDIAVKNVSARLAGLKNDGVITVSEFEHGKPTIVKSKIDNPAVQDAKTFLTWLKKMNETKGLPTDLEFLRREFIDADFNEEEVLLYLQEKKRVGFKITSQGEKFLKEHSK